MEDARRHICLGFTEERYPEGTHICYLYNSDEERRRILPLFARHALMENEAFGYLADVDTRAELPAAAAALDLTHALQGPVDQVQLLTTREGYYPDGKFDADGMLARLRAQYQQALAAGLAGARFAGEMDWALRGVPGTEHIIECESRINELVKEAPITVMCQYDLRQFDGALEFHVLNVDPVMSVGGHPPGQPPSPAG